MIPERHMKRAKRLDNGEWVQGYLHAMHERFKDGFRYTPYCIQYIEHHKSGYEHYSSVEVDPATVEDVAVRPNVGENGNVYCPNCKNKIGAFRGRSYCPDCGQRIDWSGEDE